jgi:hypothetical protein
LSSSESDILNFTAVCSRGGKGGGLFGANSCARAPQVLSNVTRFLAAGLELKQFARACANEDETKWKVRREKVAEEILMDFRGINLEGVLQYIWPDSDFVLSVVRGSTTVSTRNGASEM